MPYSNKQAELISIVMPLKNAEKYLEACLNSILEQSDEWWELLIVDDHSTDESWNIAASFREADPRIHLQKNKGSGIIPALQTAYQDAKGKLIHRMDADDLMPPQKLKILRSLIVENGKGYVATGHVKYFAAGGVSNGYRKYEQWLNRLCDEQSHWKELYKECVIASPCWLIHRSDFERCGGFNSALYPEDYDLVFRFYQHGIQVCASKQVLHLWRDHEARSSRNHEHYQQNSFFRIKLHYFLQLDFTKQGPLIIWGAGPKGKIMAKLLKQKNINFQWVSNNPNKHGKEIYDKLMHSFRHIVSQDRPQVIVTVAQRNAQAEILRFLSQQGLTKGKDFFFFR